MLFLTIVLSKEVGDNVKWTELPVVKPSVVIDLSVSQDNFCTKDNTAISFIFNEHSICYLLLSESIEVS